MELFSEEMLVTFLVITAVVVSFAAIVFNIFQQPAYAGVNPEKACQLYKDKFEFYRSDIASALSKTPLPAQVQYPAAFVAALITQESGWNPEAERFEPKLSDSSYGLMQVVPSKHPECDRQKLISDPAYNIDCGVAFLSQNFRDCAGDERQALTKYNTGSCAGKTFDPQYVDKILSYYSAWQKCTG